MPSQQIELAVDPTAVPYLNEHPEAVQELAKCAASFRYFLKYWYFKNGETKEIILLGDVLWPSQEIFIEEMVDNDKIYALKARKLGETTLAAAYDGWVMRFRGANERVHLFSRRDDAARELLGMVKFGLQRLPKWMRLPVERSTSHEYALRGGPDDERLAKAYPADEETAVEATATHAHIDEWARMGNPEAVFQAIEPSLAGTAHIITTGRGPANYTADFWRRALSGDTEFKAVFIDALKREGRDESWLAKKRAGMTEEQFKQEYAMRWEDALFGGGDFVFKTTDIDKCGNGAWGEMDPEDDRIYVKAWDVGRHKDAAVGIVLDVTDPKEPEQVVLYKRFRRLPYPDLQKEIEWVHKKYDGMTIIESNAAGEAVMENLDLPKNEVEGFSTTGQSKPKIISRLQIAIEQGTIKFDINQYKQLADELRGYQTPDTKIVQDSVMALAIAHSHSDVRPRRGRLLGVWRS